MQTKASHGLVVDNVSKQYPGTLALDGVSLEVRPGEVVALLGENGAGKSTVAKIVAGAVPPTSGTMTLDGRPFAPSSPAEAQAQGIALIHQETRLMPDLSIAENVMLGNWPKRRGMVDHREMRRIAQEKLDLLDFRPSLDTPVSQISVAGQQQIEVAKALAQDARILMLDEPTTALSGHEVEALFDTVRHLRDKGVGFIYVSHRLEEIAQICDRIVVLRDGKWVASHDTADVPTDQLVSEMVGRSVDRLFPAFAEPKDEVVLEVEGLSDGDSAFSDISFDVRGGEVFGIAGLVGAGRSETLRAIAGIDQVKEGSVSVEGEAIPTGSVRAAIDGGIAFVPEDRKKQGIIVGDTIQENVFVPNMDLLSRNGVVDGAKVSATTAKVISDMGIKGSPSDLCDELSGGNQQKVVIGRWLNRNPKVMLLDEPTRGIDVGARSAIYETIADLAEQGMAVVVVSSDLEEVLGLSHRVMVLSRGKNRGIMAREEASPEAVMHLATSDH